MRQSKAGIHVAKGLTYSIIYQHIIAYGLYNIMCYILLISEITRLYAENLQTYIYFQSRLQLTYVYDKQTQQ